jgi:hypothetical protein
MKKSITLAALILALGTGVFAATPAKSSTPKRAAEVSFASLPADNGFSVKVSKEEAGKSVVIIYDQDKNVIFKDLLSKGTQGEKGYVLTSLENGTYTVEVASNKSVVKKQIHVYEDEGAKSFFFIQ